MSNLAKKLPHASAPAERRGDAKPLRKDSATPSPAAANPGKTATDEPEPQETDIAAANPKEIPMPTTLEQVLISLANVRTDFAERNEAITEKLAQIAAENAKRDQERERANAEKLAQIAAENAKRDRERDRENTERDRITAERDRSLVERIANIEIRMADRDKELIKWFVGIAFALFLANAAVTNFILKPQLEAPAPVATFYPAPAPSTTATTPTTN